MKVLDKNVLVEQILTKKDSPILHIEEKPDNETVYESKLEVIEVGPECPSDVLAVGDVPVMNKWAEPLSIKVIEGDPGDYKIVRHLIYSFETIIATDNPS